MNYHQFLPESYGKEKLKKTAKLTSQQFNAQQPTFAYVQTSINSLEDETDLINIGQYTEEKYMQFKMKTNEVSTWTNYPERYKFMSLDFSLDMDIQHTDRTSYDILNMTGDVGGLIEVLLIAFTILAVPFRKITIAAIVTSKVFHLSVDNVKQIFNKNTLSKEELKDHNLYKNSWGEIQFKIPPLLMYQYLKHLLCNCMGQTKFSK